MVGLLFETCGYYFQIVEAEGGENSFEAKKISRVVTTNARQTETADIDAADLFRGLRKLKAPNNDGMIIRTGRPERAKWR